MAGTERIPTIIVHGGAGYIPKTEGNDITRQYHDGVKIAAKAGYQALCGESGSALDAVEAAVSAMENLPVFNTGMCS